MGSSLLLKTAFFCASPLSSIFKEIVPLAGVNLKAFESKFTSIVSSFSLSTNTVCSSGDFISWYVIFLEAAFSLKNRKTSEHRTDFFAARKMYYDNKSAENWDYLLKKAKIYFSDTVTNTSDYNSIGWDIFMYYKKHNDVSALTIIIFPL